MEKQNLAEPQKQATSKSNSSADSSIGLDQKPTVGLPEVPICLWGVPISEILWTVGWFLGGVALGVGNHIYFTRLDGQRYENEEWVGRYSIIMVVVAQACFATVVEKCFTQAVWLALRGRRGMSLFAIDSVFTAPANVLSFLVKEIYICAPLVVVLAAMGWLLKALTVFPPATLNAGLINITNIVPCQVPSLDFSQSWSLSVSRANSTDGTGVVPQELVRRNYIGDYDGTTSFGFRVATTTGFLGYPVALSSTCGTNCSYEVTFLAPSMQCTTADRQNSSLPWVDGEISSPYTPPYPARNSTEYDLSIPSYSSLIHKKTNYLWVGQNEAKNIIMEGNTFSDNYNLDIFYCRNMNTSFTVRYSFMEGMQNAVEIVNLTHLHEIKAFDSLSEEDEWREAATSIFEAVTSLLTGYSLWDRSGGAWHSSIIDLPPFRKRRVIGIPRIRDGFVIDEGYNRNEEIGYGLRDLVEQLSVNYTLSLLGYRELQYSLPVTVQCMVTTTMVIWTYSSFALLVTYGSAGGFALIALLVGGLAVRKNGYVAGSGFSQALFTTRNPELDELAKGTCLGRSDALDSKVGKAKLRFGEVLPEVTRDAGVVEPGHVAFGLLGDVSVIKKGGKYT